MQRLQEYHKQTAPLVEYYKEKGILVDSESVNDIDQALQNTKNAIGV